MTDAGDGSGSLDDGVDRVSEETAGAATSPAESGESDSSAEAGTPQLTEPTPSTVGSSRSRLDEETLAAYTTDRRTLDPTVRIQWSIRTTLTAVVLGLILSTILASFGVSPVFGAAGVTALFVLGLVWVFLRYRVWVYQIRDDSVYLERGVVTHVRTIVPYVRIQHVDTSRSALERALGLSTLVVYTAGSRGADVSIPGLEPEEARDLQQRLKELAIEAEGDDAL